MSNENNLNDFLATFDDFLYAEEYIAIITPKKYLFYSENNTKLHIIYEDFQSFWEVLRPEVPNYKYRHRVDGPAVIGSGNNGWWTNGCRLSYEKQEILNAWWKSKNGK